MCKFMRLAALLLSCLLFGCSNLDAATSNADNVRVNVDWETFMQRHDPVWDKMPQRWYDAPFMGNGMVGTLVRQIGENQVRWDVGRSDVHDHRQEDDYTVRSPEILNRGRLPIGHFVLQTVGKITSGQMRIDLWDAEGHGTIVTDKGKIDWRTYVHAEDMLIAVALAPSEGEKDYKFEFVPERAESSRYTQSKKGLPEGFVDRYKANPDPVMQQIGDISVCEQPLAAGGSTATAWWSEVSGASRGYLISVAHSYPEQESPQTAVDAIRKMRAEGRVSWEKRHRQWWHDYYKQSFVSISDTVWESYYWIQMYKLACATRAEAALIDNQGPWLQPTGWNGTWWNLNVQLSYSPVYTANRLGLGESLTGHLSRNFQTLIDNVEQAYRQDSAGISRNTAMDLKGKAGKPGGWDIGERDIGCEVGNLTWTCHNLWRQYRFSMDERLRDELLYPLLKRGINYYRHFLYEGPDGRLHLPETHSPEYGNAEDANYDLSLIRWGCLRMIELAEERGVEEPLVSEWNRILDKLVDYPENENGFMIGKKAGFDKSHRHWSHLLMIYPLHVVTPDKDRELIEKSLDRWHSFKGALAGYSYTGGASFSALLGNGDKTLEFLNGFLPYMGASTMYYEGGRQGLPVMETPLHGAQAIQEMLLQSWGGVIRVFPALPDKWKDVEFDRLLAEGAFEVSATRIDGVTQWIAIRSLADAKCVMETDIDEPAAYVNGKARPLNKIGNSRYELKIVKGEQAIISAKTAPITNTVVSAVSADDTVNYFGINSRSNRKK